MTWRDCIDNGADRLAENGSSALGFAVALVLVSAAVLTLLIFKMQ